MCKVFCLCNPKALLALIIRKIHKKRASGTDLLAAYKHLAAEILPEAWNLLNHQDWKVIEETSQDDVVSSLVFQNRKIYKLSVTVDATPKHLLHELFYKVEELPKWDWSLADSRRLEIIDQRTDITYQISYPALGGLVKSRDFITLRTWHKYEDCYLIAYVGIDHVFVPKDGKYVRGVNGLSCWAIHCLEDDLKKCRFEWVLNVDLKVWIPSRVLENACVDMLFKYADCLRTHVKKCKQCSAGVEHRLLYQLKTGWSVKTGSMGFQSSLPPLGADEQAAILDVIRRAEQLDHLEQERVGKLVERLETMRRNALGRTANQCLLCGDGFGVLGAQKCVCIDCRRLVCQKCAIDNSPTKTRSSKSSWLCMICAETREIWKKSGAWFFKSLPKYILPSQQAGITRNLRSSRKAKKGKKFREDSSSDEDRPIWPRIEKRNSSTESTHEVQDLTQEQMYSRQTSSSESQVSKDYDQAKAISIAAANEAKSWDELDSRMETASAESSELSRRDSVASRTISEWNWTTDSRSDEKVSPSASSIGSSVFKNPIDENKMVDTSMGIIELSLTYDPVTITLHCTVYRAKNLIPMDINGLADPFCKLNILPNPKTSTRLRTKTVHKTRNPEFNENLTFYDLTENDLTKKSLHVLVLDDDKYGHDYMGEARINLAKLRLQNTVYLTLPLEKLRVEQKGPLPAPELKQWFDDLWDRGQILISLCYSTKKRALLVTVVRCANLLPMDNNGFSDPFVKLHLRPDPYHRKYKTSIKWKNLNPVFNEEFHFETRPTELATQSLYLTVWDKDYGKSNDYLGGLILGGPCSKGLRLKHWLDMIRYPDHRQEAWHNLTEDPLND